MIIYKYIHGFQGLILIQYFFGPVNPYLHPGPFVVDKKKKYILSYIWNTKQLNSTQAKHIPPTPRITA